MIGLICIFSYKAFHILRGDLKAIYGKFDTIYYMLCDIFKKRHDRSEKKRNK